MKCLVTGGAGFIGSHITRNLLDTGYEVICQDNFDPFYSSEKKRANVAPFLNNDNFTLVEGDIRDRELLNELIKDIDYVFHEAALVSVVESMKDPVRTVEVNTIGTFNILKEALEAGVKKVIIASSAAVYGDSPELPKTEDMIPDPRSPYAISKLDCEYAARIFYEEYGLMTTILRYFNVYGPGQDPASPYAAAIPIFIRKALQNETISVYGDGTQTRDFIYIRDVVEANRIAMSAGDGKVFNVASGSSIEISELVDMIIEISNSCSEVKYSDPRPGEIKHSLADISEIAKIGFKPGLNLKMGLESTIKWFRDLQMQ